MHAPDYYQRIFKELETVQSESAHCSNSPTLNPHSRFTADSGLQARRRSKEENLSLFTPFRVRSPVCSNPWRQPDDPQIPVLRDDLSESACRRGRADVQRKICPLPLAHPGSAPDGPIYGKQYRPMPSLTASTKKSC